MKSLIIKSKKDGKILLKVVQRKDYIDFMSHIDLDYFCDITIRHDDNSLWRPLKK